jgi:hypothetical protein
MEEILASIDRIRAFDLASVTIDAIKDELTILLRGYQVSAPSFGPGLKVYRARKRNAGPPAFLREIGAPAAANVRSDQRCNRSGETMFYCSSARNAPFFEIHAQAGDYLVLSEWRTTCPLLVNHVGYTGPTFGRLQSGRQHPTWGVKPFDLLSDPRLDIIDEFLGSLFAVPVPAGQEHLYKATIAVTEKLIPSDIAGGAVDFGGLMYPTIPMNGNCDNFALRPRFVERGLAFVKAEYIAVREVNGMVINFNVLDFANSVDADGALEWKGRLGKWVMNQGDILQFSHEIGEWVARDLAGRIVQPE